MALWNKTTTKKNLDVGDTKLLDLVKNDPTFPRPIKLGAVQQARVYFDADEMNAWIEAQKAKRTECAVEVAQ